MRLPHGLSWTRGEPCCVRETAQWSYDGWQSRSAAFISFLIRDKEQDGVEYNRQILEE